MLYAKGAGVAEDFPKARHWFQQAAEQGDAGAQSGLGYLYAGGLGVDQSWASAQEWYEKAAAQGYAKACNNLGHMFLTGQGVQTNVVEAYKWFRLSVEMGYQNAEEIMQKVGTELSPEELAKAQATRQSFLKKNQISLPQTLPAEAAAPAKDLVEPAEPVKSATELLNQQNP